MIHKKELMCIFKAHQFFFLNHLNLQILPRQAVHRSGQIRLRTPRHPQYSPGKDFLLHPQNSGR